MQAQLKKNIRLSLRLQVHKSTRLRVGRSRLFQDYGRKVEDQTSKVFRPLSQQKKDLTAQTITSSKQVCHRTLIRQLWQAFLFSKYANHSHHFCQRRRFLFCHEMYFFMRFHCNLYCTEQCVFFPREDVKIPSRGNFYNYAIKIQ